MKPTFRRKEKLVILFDLQDTLVDPKSAFLQALQVTLSEFTARWMPEHELGAWSPDQSVQHYAMASIGRTHGERMEVLRQALSESPFFISDAFLSSVWMRAKELAPLYAQAYPDVRETLEQLQPHYRLAIISNGNRQNLEDMLYHAGLQTLFPDDHIFTTSVIRVKKPNPMLFNKALKALGISPSDAVMVGNSWRNDVRGAAAARIDAVWVHKDHKNTVRRRLGNSRVIIVSRFRKLLELFEHGTIPY